MVQIYKLSSENLTEPFLRSLVPNLFPSFVQNLVPSLVPNYPSECVVAVCAPVDSLVV